MAEKEEKIISAKRINVIVQELKGLVSEHLLTKPILQEKLGIANWALEPTKPAYVKGDIGLGNVENTAFYKHNLTINGATRYFASTTKDAEGISLYAPTTVGESGQVLKSNGSGAPSWSALTKSDVGLGNVENTAFYRRICIVNGTQYSMSGTVSADGFSIYAPTSYGSAEGMLLTSVAPLSNDRTPIWKAPSSITVGKATQLANTRKIWGKSFNGTQDISGDMTEVGKIEANGNITTQGGVSAKGIADFGTDTQIMNVQTVEITSTGASSYTFTHSLATEDLVLLAITVSGGTVYDGYNIAFGNTVPQSTATNVGNFIRWKANSANSITLAFRSTAYAPVSGQKIRVTIMRANF